MPKCDARQGQMPRGAAHQRHALGQHQGAEIAGDRARGAPQDQGKQDFSAHEVTDADARNISRRCRKAPEVAAA
jgi:hypothetical protein